MSSVKFPDVQHPDSCFLFLQAQIFYPEVTDIYDKKNMPRVIYCIHALRCVTCYHLSWDEQQLCRVSSGIGTGAPPHVQDMSMISLHSRFLFQLGIAPKIQDLHGIAQFTGDHP